MVGDDEGRANADPSGEPLKGASAGNGAPASGTPHETERSAAEVRGVGSIVTSDDLPDGFVPI